MKNATIVVMFTFFCAASGLAQTPQTFGAWSIYPGVSSGRQTVTLLQTTSLQQDENGLGPLKLDVICRRGELYRVAVETPTVVSEQAMNFSAALPTTPVSLQAGEGKAEIQKWGVLDGGHTVSPYSEVRQGKTNRTWTEHLAGVDTLTLELNGNPQAAPIHARFHTAGLSQALASIGCSY